MGYETERANIALPSDVISSAISEALVQGVVVSPLIYSEDLPTGGPIRKKFRKAGYLIAEEVNESAVLAIDGAGQEYTETSVNSDAVKLCAACIGTVEAEKFGGFTPQQAFVEIGKAIARDVDDEVKALLDDGTYAATCTAGATIDKALDAEYSVRRYSEGVGDGPLTMVVNYKAASELQKDLIASSASVWTNPNMATILRGSTPGGFVGTLGNGMLNVFRTSGVPTTGTDDVGCVFHPQWAFASMADSGPTYNERWLGAGDGTRGFATEYTGYFFYDAVLWNDYLTCEFRSDT
jgi:hypothetical protein